MAGFESMNQDDIDKTLSNYNGIGSTATNFNSGEKYTASSSKKKRRSNTSSWRRPTTSTMTDAEALSQALSEIQPLTQIQTNRTNKLYEEQRQRLPAALNAIGRTRGGSEFAQGTEITNDQASALNEISLNEQSSALNLARQLKAAADASARQDVLDNYGRWKDSQDMEYRDKAFDRGVLESNRTFNRGVLESDRNYGFNVEGRNLDTDYRNKQFGLDQDKFEETKRSNLAQEGLARAKAASSGSKLTATDKLNGVRAGVVDFAQRQMKVIPYNSEAPYNAFLAAKQLLNQNLAGLDITNDQYNDILQSVAAAVGYDIPKTSSKSSSGSDLQTLLSSLNGE